MPAALAPQVWNPKEFTQASIIGESPTIVSGTHLSPTYRTVAFASWLDSLGRLEFVEATDAEKNEFYVPRVIEEMTLKKRKQEKKKISFPKRGDGNDIALYLGLKLVPNGSVAIFCGRKDTAINLCRSLVDYYSRDLPLVAPSELSDPEEVERLRYIHEVNMGVQADSTKAANLGIFVHHGHTPQGIRFAIEHAMKQGLAKFVVCTSTLAQGVNLPIRYLIVTSIYQGAEKIRNRDFHNLIGRVGRSGMHTEGSILFADPNVYDNRRGSKKDRWRWREFKRLLNPENSEPCASVLLSIFDPIENDLKSDRLKMEPLSLVKLYINNPKSLDTLAASINEKYAGKNYSKAGVERQLQWKLKIITSIESFLMASWDDSEIWGHEEIASDLAKGTLAYHLSDDSRKLQLIELFRLLASNISTHVSEPKKRKVFGKTMYGVRDSIEIEEWTIRNAFEIISCETQNALFEVLWPVLEKYIRNPNFQKCTAKEALYELAVGWLQGRPFSDLYAALIKSGAKIGLRKVLIEHVVDICENALGYEGALIVGAVNVVCDLQLPLDTSVPDDLQLLQKRLKYGLASASAVAIYELGLSDRVIAAEVCQAIGPVKSKKRALAVIRSQWDVISDILEKYPRYFQDRLAALL